MRKTKLSLALSAVLAGAMLSAPAQAVQLANDDGLGDAALFQYYTAKSGWQTFIRLINTSNDAITVKVRFREAANSREVLDFVVALSPNDMWSAWTDEGALNGQPGIRTNDTSCVFDPPDTGSNTFQTIDASRNLIGAAFSDDAFTAPYDDGAGIDAAARMKEGHIEVIGLARHPIGSDFANFVTHGSNDVPFSCTQAYNILRNAASSQQAFDGALGGELANGDSSDVGNVLAANAQLINVANGEGAGYDPTMLANFATGDLSGFDLLGQALGVTIGGLDSNSVANGPKPDMDSADPVSTVLTVDGTAIFSNWDFDGNGVADQQLLANGSVAQIPQNVGDIADGATPGGQGNGIIDNETASFYTSTGTLIDDNVAENNIPNGIVAALNGNKVIACADPVLLAAAAAAGDDFCLQIVSSSSPSPAWAISISAQNTVAATQANPARRTNLPNAPVTGGVDAVSAVLARTSIINEWGAFSNPTGFIKDYFTQWVINFPTKHYYVDLQDDANTSDSIAPTLWDPRGDSGTDLNDAFTPFSFEFNTADGSGNAVGKSCEAYTMQMFNTEESERGFNSPRQGVEPDMCYETQVVSFGNAFTTKGLNSDFSVVVPELFLPPNRMVTPFTAAQRGWARLSFTGTGSNTGLTALSSHAAGSTTGTNPVVPTDANPLIGLTGATLNPVTNGLVNYQGLPVNGFKLTSYGTGNAGTNHNAINDHKYEREINSHVGATVSNPGLVDSEL